VNNKNVCYHYNKAAGCRRLRSGTGCKDAATGEEFSHSCTWWFQDKQVFCLAAHPKGRHPR